jgi:hypothetical protein
MNQGMVMHLVSVDRGWRTHPRRREDPASIVASGAQLLHLAMLHHEQMTTVAGTSTPVIAARGNAPMAP